MDGSSKGLCLHVVRAVGACIAVVAVAGAGFVIEKLYTGRGGATPIRSALIEQPLVALIGAVGLVAGLVLMIWPGWLASLRRWANPHWVWRERRGEASLLLVSTLLSLGLLEVGSRWLYARQFALPFTFSVEELIYPPLNYEMRRYTTEKPAVLLLGGSVLWSAGARAELQAGLPEYSVYNMAQTGHSTLDSLNKYTWLLEQGYHFDVVVYCHGINDARANNCPPDVFRVDYDHYSFYQVTNTVLQHKRPVLRALLHSMVFYRVYQLWATLRQTRSFGHRYLHVAYPREDWLQYGGDVRSAASFERNLMGVADLAKADGAHLLVLYFAYNPVLDAWAEGRLKERDAEMITMTEQWGLPQHIREGMIVHNEVLERHRDEYVYVEETKSLMEGDGMFADACHFLEPGMARYIAIIQEAVHQADAPRAQ